MYAPVYQGLTPFDLARPARTPFTCFPFDAPRHWYFYRARNAIYHLFRQLCAARPGLRVLAPEYNSGNEILAMQAAGAVVRACPVGRDLLLDPSEVERICARGGVDVLYVIHYAGWPQPMPALVDLCRRRGMLLIEDCALALLSHDGARPLGTYGDWSVFCLYKTLPLPNGAVLVQNTPNETAASALDGLRLQSPGLMSAAGRTAELLVQRFRSRFDRAGAALYDLKQRIGRGMSALNVHRAAIGDIGFDTADVDLAMADVSTHILRRLDFDDIRATRIANATRLASLLRGIATPVFDEVPNGVCPLFFPILVRRKHEAALALQQRGVDALEFWNDRAAIDGHIPSPAERFLRAHVLELPIHQDLTPAHVEFVARQVAALNLRMPDAASTVFAA